jgi:V8-like Glu-specific endopeptidase
MEQKKETKRMTGSRNESDATLSSHDSAPRPETVPTGGNPPVGAPAAAPIGLEPLAEVALSTRGVDVEQVKRVAADPAATATAAATTEAAAPASDLEILVESYTGPSPVAEEAFQRDIGDAALPPTPRSSLPLLESIIGEVDARTRVTQTTQFPYRAIASLEITAADGSQWVGTGWFIGPRTVITAGHCVFVHSPQIPGANGWVRSIRVIPGRDGASRPFGFVDATKFRSVAGWTQRADPEFDYAAIILPPGSDLGERVGQFFETAALSDLELKTMFLNVAGYPGDKRGAEAGTLWIDAKRTASVTANKVYYDLDTMGGQSGAPVFAARPDGRRVAVGIHAYGVSGDVRSNSGTRIHAGVLARMEQWKLL